MNVQGNAFNVRFQKIKITTLVLCCFCALVFFVNYLAKDKAISAQTKNKQVEEIEGYKNWTKVNVEPQLMPARVAVLCADATGNNKDLNGPHQSKYFTVYVNDIGRQAMLEQSNPKFPEGSVIVKEKLPDQKSLTPELLTMMIKRKKDFDSANGDWEYLVTDATGAKIERRGNLQNCQACHVASQKTDYIFRTYLSAEVRNELK